MASYLWALVALLPIMPVLVRRLRGEFSVKGKHVLVTGGSQGLGRAVAQQLAAAGASVSLVARSRDKLDKVVNEITASSAVDSAAQKIAAYPADVTDFAALQAAVAAAEGNAGPVDVLIANAGAAVPGYFAEMDIEVFRKQMDLNYLGVVHAVRAVLPGMQQRRSGRLVLVSSAAAFGGFVGYSAYSPSKAAVRMLADCLRNELLPFKISVQSFYPSTMATPGLQTEEETKPVETKEIEESDVAISEAQSGRDLVRMIRTGQATGTQEMLTELGRAVTSGLTPRHNIVLEIALAPLLVIAQTGYMLLCDHVVKKHAPERLKR